MLSSSLLSRWDFCDHLDTTLQHNRYKNHPTPMLSSSVPSSWDPCFSLGTKLQYNPAEDQPMSMLSSSMPSSWDLCFHLDIKLRQNSERIIRCRCCLLPWHSLEIFASTSTLQFNTTRLSISRCRCRLPLCHLVEIFASTSDIKLQQNPTENQPISDVVFFPDIHLRSLLPSEHKTSTQP